MPNKNKDDEWYCNARIREHRVPDDWNQDVAYCANKAGFRTDHTGDGRCYLHGGAAKTVQKGNNNAEKHGLYSDRQNYYEHRSSEEQAWIDAVVESLLDDAPFDSNNMAKLQMVRNIAIDMHKQQRANDYIDEVGVVNKDKTVGYTDDGRPIKEDQENVLNVAYDRLNRTQTRQMKELGLLEDPDSQQAEAEQNIASELSELRKARESKEE
jgi:hypothetical protein